MPKRKSDNKENESIVSKEQSTKKGNVHKKVRKVLQPISVSNDNTDIVANAEQLKSSPVVQLLASVSEDDITNITDIICTGNKKNDLKLEAEENVNLFLSQENSVPSSLIDLKLPASAWCTAVPFVLFDFNTQIDGSPAVETSREYDDDPDYVWTLADGIYQNYLEAEQRLRPDWQYMVRHNKFNVKYRAMAINYMLNIARHMELLHHTVFLAVHVLDSFMARRIFVDLSGEKMKVIAHSCLMIAAKFEEGGQYPRGWFLKIFLHKMIDRSQRVVMRQSMISYETKIVMATFGCLYCPTSMTFLNRYLLASEASTIVVTLARCVCERALLEYSMLQYLPSVVAACAVTIARSILKLPAWTRALQEASGYTQSHLHDCTEDLQDIFAMETAVRAKEYVVRRLLGSDPANHTFGKLTMKVMRRNEEGSDVSSRDQVYESYLVPIFESYMTGVHATTTFDDLNTTSSVAFFSSNGCNRDDVYATPSVVSPLSITTGTGTDNNACYSNSSNISSCSMSSVYSYKAKMSDMLPQISHKGCAPLLDSVMCRFSHSIYNRLITCCYYDNNRHSSSNGSSSGSGGGGIGSVSSYVAANNASSVR